MYPYYVSENMRPIGRFIHSNMQGIGLEYIHTDMVHELGLESTRNNRVPGKLSARGLPTISWVSVYPSP